MRIGERVYEGAKCKVSFCDALPAHMRKDIREISHLETLPEFRHRGHATELMKYICKDADNRKIVLVLMVEPYGGDAPMTTEQLVEWYAKFGFTPLPNGDKVMLARMHAVYIKKDKK